MGPASSSAALGWDVNQPLRVLISVYLISHPVPGKERLQGNREHSSRPQRSLLVSRSSVLALKLTQKRSLRSSNSFRKLLQSLPGNNSPFPCSSHFGEGKAVGGTQNSFVKTHQGALPGHSQLWSPTAPCSAPQNVLLRLSKNRDVVGDDHG